MAFVSAQKSRAAVGLLNLSGYATGYSVPWTTEMLPTTTILDSAKAFIVGQTSSTATVNMILDTSSVANAQFDAIHDLKAAAPSPFALAPQGFATGEQVVMLNAIHTQITTESQVADVAKMDVAIIGDGALDVGVSVEDFTAITATGNGTARDLTAGTTNGGVAHLHVTAFSGLTNNAVTIEHSVNGSTGWTTLVTFTTYTAVTSQRVEVAAGTTVNRYLRVVDTVSGTGSTTRAVTFSRR